MKLTTEQRSSLDDQIIAVLRMTARRHPSQVADALRPNNADLAKDIAFTEYIGRRCAVLAKAGRITREHGFRSWLYSAKSENGKTTPAEGLQMATAGYEASQRVRKRLLDSLHYNDEPRSVSSFAEMTWDDENNRDFDIMHKRAGGGVNLVLWTKYVGEWMRSAMAGGECRRVSTGVYESLKPVRLVADMEAAVAKHRAEKAVQHDSYRTAARSVHTGNGNIRVEVSDNADVNVSIEGAWVSARIWVHQSQVVPTQIPALKET